MRRQVVVPGNRGARRVFRPTLCAAYGDDVVHRAGGSAQGRPFRGGQRQRLPQQRDGFQARQPRSIPLQIAHRPRRQAGPLRERRLGQPRGEPVAPEQRPEALNVGRRDWPQLLPPPTP